MPLHSGGNPSVNSRLALLVGTELGAVTFVRDYIQLTFDGPVLTALTSPTIARGGRRWSHGDAGYRDALCACIALPVQAATARAGEAITITFTDDTELTISLRPSDRVGPEAAHLKLSSTDPLVVW
jgi:hypothetical protein